MSFNHIVENAFKSTDEVINRIFNHRPFLEAEIRSMIKYFEKDVNKSGDIEQLLDCSLVRVKDVNDNQLECALNVVENKSTSVCEKIEKIEEMMQRVLDAELTKEVERKSNIDSFIAEQDRDFAQFLQQQERRINEIDNSYERARKQVCQKYSDEER